jgi:hypothetical protein
MGGKAFALVKFSKKKKISCIYDGRVQTRDATIVFFFSKGLISYNPALISGHQGKKHAIGIQVKPIIIEQKRAGYLDVLATRTRTCTEPHQSHA